MARLIIKTDGIHEQVLELRLGVNRLGRGPENDFQIEHPTISGLHCEVELRNGKLVVRDCNSTNGTSVAGRPIKEASLSQGQSFCMGDVLVVVDSTDMSIAIPEFELPSQTTAGVAPVVKTEIPAMEGACFQHSQILASYRCPHCGVLVCDGCVHRLQRRGGRLMNLCPRCSHECVPLKAEQKTQKQNFFQMLAKTVKLSFAHQPSDEEK